MKLKYYNFSIIIPIFFMVAFILTSFNYYIQKRELTISLNAEIESISKSASIFIKSSKDRLDKNRIKESFEKIISYDRVRRLILIKNKKIIVHSSYNNYLIDNYSYTNINNLEIYSEHGEVLYSKMSYIEDSDLKIFVTIDASSVKDKLDEPFFQSIGILILIVFIGFLVSMFLTYIVNRNISNLNYMANAISRGDYKDYNISSSITEILDLVNTLDIVKSILKEILFKTKNSILGNEFFRNKEYFSKLTIGDLENNSSIISDNFSLKMISFDQKSKKEFYSCWQDNEYIYAFIGQIKGEDNIDNYITSSGLTRLLKYYLNNKLFDIVKIDRAYDLDSIIVLQINKFTSEVEESTIVNSKIDKNSKKYILDESKYYTYFHKNSFRDNILSNYIESYSFLEINDLASDLNRIFEDRGAILIINKK